MNWTQTSGYDGVDVEGEFDINPYAVPIRRLEIEIRRLRRHLTGIYSAIISAAAFLWHVHGDVETIGQHLGLW